MSHASASVLKFPVHHAQRLPFDDPKTEDGVRELIALAPMLGRRNPASVPNVVNYMRTMIGPGPEGGVECDRRLPRTARPATHPRPRPVKVTMGDVFERIHLSDPARQAEMAPLVRAYLRAQA